MAKVIVSWSYNSDWQWDFSLFHPKSIKSGFIWLYIFLSSKSRNSIFLWNNHRTHQLIPTSIVFGLHERCVRTQNFFYCFDWMILIMTFTNSYNYKVLPNLIKVYQESLAVCMICRIFVQIVIYILYFPTCSLFPYLSSNPCFRQKAKTLTVAVTLNVKVQEEKKSDKDCMCVL